MNYIVQNTKLGSVADILVGYAFKSAEFSQNPNDVFLLKGSNISHRKIDYDAGPWWRTKNEEDLSKYELGEDDVVLAMDRPIVGDQLKFSWIKKSDPKSLLVQRVARLRGTKTLDTKYLRCVIASSEFQKYVDSITTGANVPHISGPDIKEYSFPLPPLPIQKKIAGVLSAYDDLIEANQKRIKLLEEMAQITYEEWFVRHRFPNHETTPINPETGLPEGWDLLPFESLVDFKEGPGLRNWQYRESGVPFLNIRVIKDGDVDLTKVQYLDDQEVDDKYKHFLVAENDHVISSSGTLGRLVTIRNVHLPLCMNTSLIRMRKKTERIGTWQLKHMLLAKKFQNTLESYANGSAQVNFGPIHLKQIKIFAPPNEIGIAYEKIVAPMEETIKLYRDQYALLKEARDLLLPRLMTGLIDIDDYLARNGSAAVAA